MEDPRTSQALLPVDEFQTSFSGGMRDRDHPSQLQPNQYAYGKNIEVRDSGLASTRHSRFVATGDCGSNGGTNPQGAYWYEPFPGQGMMVQIQGGAAYRWRGSSHFWEPMGNLQLNNTSDRVAMCCQSNFLYVYGSSNGSDSTWVYDPYAETWTSLADLNTSAPWGNLVAIQLGRMCVAGVDFTVTPNIQDTRQYIFYSDTFVSAFNRVNNNTRISTDGGEPVKAISPYRNGQIIAWTRNNTKIIDISSANVASFVQQTLDSHLGCVAPMTVVPVGEDVFFLSPDGHVRTIKRTQQDTAYGVSTPVSFWVPNLMGRINKHAMGKCAAAFFNNYYLLAAPMDTSGKNNGLIVFDLLQSIQVPSSIGQTVVPICVGEWTNINAFQFVVTNFNNIQELYYIDSTNGAAVKMFDSGQNDGSVNLTGDGQPIVHFVDSTIKTRAPNWNTPRHDKTMHDLEMQFLNTFGTVTVSYARDDGNFNALFSGAIGDTSKAILGSASTILPFYLASDPGLVNLPLSFFRQGRSRNWQLQIDFTGGTMNLKEITMSAFIEGASTRQV